MQTTETHPIIIAIMQAPKQTDREREQVTMLLAPNTMYEDVTECLLGEPMDAHEVASLLGPDARDMRRECGLSSDRLRYAIWVASALKRVAKDLGNIDPLDEFSLHVSGVMLQRVPRIVTENSMFTFLKDDERVTESYEDFIFPSSTWIWDRLTQDYSIEGAYLPSEGDFTLLDLMNLWVWERDTGEMGDRLNLDGFGIRIYEDGPGL